MNFTLDDLKKAFTAGRQQYSKLTWGDESIETFTHDNFNEWFMNFQKEKVEFCSCGNPSGGHHCFIDENIIECADCGGQVKN